MSFFKKRNGKVRPSSKDSLELPSITSTMGSMTQSQLNSAIMDMLTLPQDRNQCETAFRGNPVTNSGKRKQMIKILTIVLIPVAVLIGMTGNSFITLLTEYFESSAIRNTLRYSLDLGQFLRVLQRERDMSSLYLSKIGPDTKSFLLQCYPDTDTALENLSIWPVSPKNDRSEFKTRDAFLMFLNRHRYRLDIQVREPKDELLFYTEVIDIFIKWLYDAISEARIGVVWKTLVAYQEIIVASEFIGRERGLGSTFYIHGKFKSREDYLLFVEAQDSANVTFQSCRRYSPVAYEMYEESLSQNTEVLNTIRKMRLEIRSNKSTQEKGSIKMAEWWFENMTIYQDVVGQTQTALAKKIDRTLKISSSDHLRNIFIISGIFGMVVILCPLIVLAVYHLTSDIQKYSASIVNRTKALNKEKKRTDTLLYQLLPMTVAERLKKNEHVDAEQYQEATIFFSDIVGFTQISSQSSPLQVVDMLNSLYLCFDHRIETYDVYKVETIGDAYMVVSGVPKANGNRHAAEIGTMALDLLQHIQHLEIPHLPGTKFKVRIGCHSGPVVAGVVGTKMPRYCLFGETVNVASKIESLGGVNKIHISESTRDLLAPYENFVVEENVDTAPKMDLDVLNAFKGIVRTYWLVERSDFLFSVSDSSCSTLSAYGRGGIYDQHGGPESYWAH